MRQNQFDILKALEAGHECIYGEDKHGCYYLSWKPRWADAPSLKNADTSELFQSALIEVQGGYSVPGKKVILSDWGKVVLKDGVKIKKRRSRILTKKAGRQMLKDMRKGEQDFIAALKEHRDK